VPAYPGCPGKRPSNGCSVVVDAWILSTIARNLAGIMEKLAASLGARGQVHHGGVQRGAMPSLPRKMNCRLKWHFGEFWAYFSEYIFGTICILHKRFHSKLWGTRHPASCDLCPCFQELTSDGMETDPFTIPLLTPLPKSIHMTKMNKTCQRNQQRTADRCYSVISRLTDAVAS